MPMPTRRMYLLLKILLPYYFYIVEGIIYVQHRTFKTGLRPTQYRKQYNPESQLCTSSSSTLTYPSEVSIRSIGPTYTILYSVFAIKKHAKPKTNSPAVMQQNHFKSPSAFCPGTQTFIPHRPVMIFIGRTIVPRTVSFPSTSAVCSWRSFMRILICAR